MPTGLAAAERQGSFDSALKGLFSSWDTLKADERRARLRQIMDALGGEMRQRFGFPRRSLDDRLRDVGQAQLDNMDAFEKLLEKPDS
jgi:hypothetical protein